MSEAELGDYSYMMQDCGVWCATIGKFVNIAAAVRINATNHPTWRPTLHHFTYRASDYWDDAEHETEFFDMRRSKRVTIGHDTWLGHGSTILPGVTVGDGAAIGAGAVVSKDVAPYTIVAGVPAKPIRERFDRKDCRALPGAGLVGLGSCETACRPRRFPPSLGRGFLGETRRVGAALAQAERSYPFFCGWSVSPRASIATNFSMRAARVFSVLASWTR